MSPTTKAPTTKAPTMSPTTEAPTKSDSVRTVGITIEDPADIASVQALADEGFRTFQQEVRRIFTLALRAEMSVRSLRPDSADSVSPKG